MRLATELCKDFVDKKGLVIASVISLQPAGINRSEVHTPEPDGFTADRDAWFREGIFDVPVTVIESVVEPKSLRRFMGTE